MNSKLNGNKAEGAVVINDNPVEDAEVEILNSSIEPVTTNNDGRFEIEIPNGEYEVSVDGLTANDKLKFKSDNESEIILNLSDALTEGTKAMPKVRKMHNPRKEVYSEEIKPDSNEFYYADLKEGTYYLNYPVPLGGTFETLLDTEMEGVVYGLENNTWVSPNMDDLVKSYDNVALILQGPSNIVLIAEL